MSGLDLVYWQLSKKIINACTDTHVYVHDIVFLHLSQYLNIIIIHYYYSINI